ncbi:MAG TPA: fluoride efflux transporter CrcB [Chthoniobacteraceae bacterium]
MISWKSYLFVMLGGAIGSALRLWMGSHVTALAGAAFPIGTLVVNVLGCLAIGAYAAWAEVPGAAAGTPLVQQFVVVGLLGGFTTFSSFSLQTWELLRAGEATRAGVNVLLSVALCLGATWLGYTFVRACISR